MPARLNKFIKHSAKCSDTYCASYFAWTFVLLFDGFCDLFSSSFSFSVIIPDRFYKELGSPTRFSLLPTFLIEHLSMGGMLAHGHYVARKSGAIVGYPIWVLRILFLFLCNEMKLGWAVWAVWAVWVVWVLGWLFVLGVWCVEVSGLLCRENMERHRQAKGHDNEEGSGEMGTDSGASKTLWPSG